MQVPEISGDTDIRKIMAELMQLSTQQQLDTGAMPPYSPVGRINLFG